MSFTTRREGGWAGQAGFDIAGTSFARSADVSRLQSTPRGSLLLHLDAVTDRAAHSPRGARGSSSTAPDSLVRGRVPRVHGSLSNRAPDTKTRNHCDNPSPLRSPDAHAGTPHYYPGQVLGTRQVDAPTIFPAFSPLFFFPIHSLLFMTLFLLPSPLSFLLLKEFLLSPCRGWHSCSLTWMDVTRPFPLM